MKADEPTRSQAGTGAPALHTSDLEGLTDAIGRGLDSTGTNSDPLLGAKIGDVTVVRVIAEGGMGRVYEGLQDKPRRPVAVKVIRPDCVSKEVIRRFELESEVLGRLSHPHIAHVHSAGIDTRCGDRVPYFVMEYISDALPLTEFLRQRDLTVAARLELFRKVCDAVAYGHSHEQQVVHRDLKPSNILVDRAGNPKVIDFGIARCVDTTNDAATTMTTTGQIIGSVQYMSPEQFAGDPSAIDSRTDVYSLGLILHEVLVGKLPYDVRKKSIVEAAKVVSEYRSTWSDDLRVRLGPELLGIIETCLRRDRNDRFVSAAELSTAIAHAITVLPERPARVQTASTTTHKAGLDGLDRRRAALLAGLAALAVGGVALVSAFFLPRPNKPPTDEKTRSFWFAGRRYEVVFAPVARADAVTEAEKRGGRLACLDTIAKRRAIAREAIGADCGLTYLWADCRADETATSAHEGVFPILSIMPPLSNWAELEAATVVGGFVVEWKE